MVLGWVVYACLVVPVRHLGCCCVWYLVGNFRLGLFVAYCWILYCCLVRWFVIVGACFVVFSFLFGVAEWCVDSGFGLVWDVYLGLLLVGSVVCICIWGCFGFLGYVGFCGVCLV